MGQESNPHGMAEIGAVRRAAAAAAAPRRHGHWHRPRIPLECFARAGADVRQVVTPLAVHTAGRLALADIRIESHTGGATPELPRGDGRRGAGSFPTAPYGSLKRRARPDILAATGAADPRWRPRGEALVPSSIFRRTPGTRPARDRAGA